MVARDRQRPGNTQENLQGLHVSEESTNESSTSSVDLAMEANPSGVCWTFHGVYVSSCHRCVF